MKRKGLALWNALCKQQCFDCVLSGGDMSTEELIEQYRQADVIVSTASVEGGPMSIVEAIAMRKPVVVGAGVGWANEFAGYTGVYLYDAGSIGSLTAAILAATKPYHPVRNEKDYATDMYNVFADALFHSEKG